MANVRTLSGSRGGASFLRGAPEKQYLHLRRLAYTWRYDGYAGDSLVTRELHSEGNATRLRLTHEGIETFPTDAPDLARKDFVAGWNSLMGTSLAEFLK